ncbi:MAG: MarR family winged helix-turn-helix transcriptional regulator [Caldilineaceae bacterium]
MSSTPSASTPLVVDEAKLYAIAQQCVCFNLRRGARAVTQYFDGLFQPYGLRATQFSVLGALAIAAAQERSVSLTQIAEALVMDRSTLARNLQPLERDGLVEIALGADRRTRVARLTPAGHARLAQVIGAWDEGQAHFAAELGIEQLAEMVQTIGAVVNAAHKHKGTDQVDTDPGNSEKEEL